MEKRFIYAFKFSARHFLISFFVVGCVLFGAFYFWYPKEFWGVTNVGEILFFIVLVDLVCGPFLTLLVVSPCKARSELFRDVFFIFTLQAFALSYGVYSLYQGRPLYLAFEKDRFRLVTAADIYVDEDDKKYTPPFSGVEFVFVKLLTPTDEGYLESVRHALQGVHPAYKPSRWESYLINIDAVRQLANPLERLAAEFAGGDEFPTGSLYLPLDSYYGGDWVVVLSPDAREFLGILPWNGWR